MSYICLFSAIIVGVVAMIIPPAGIIDKSILWFSAQLLLFVASILGIKYELFESNYIKEPKA